MEKGIAKGIEKGMEIGIEKVAANMLSHGENEENVKKYTGLSDEQIEKIKEYIKSIKSKGTH
jgi:predicted transposase/invertase (TIGR01784 family)